MRSRTAAPAVILCLLGLMTAGFGRCTTSALASDTNVFKVSNTLQGAAFTVDGVRPLRFKGNSALILGTNAAQSELALTVHDTECQSGGVHPTVRLVAYNASQNKVLAPLVEFTELLPIYVGDSRIVMQAHGQGRSGVDAADLDALVTFDYKPCQPTDAATQPTHVDIKPLGTLKPTGAISFTVPATADAGFLEIASDDPSSPIVDVSLDGRATEPSTSCHIDLSPLNLSFGTVTVGATNILTVTLRNNGGVSCAVTGLVANGSAAFTVTPPAVPFAIAAGQARTITVAFAPSLAGVDNGVLQVATTDPNNPAQYVRLSGTGVTTTPASIQATPLLLNFGSVEIGTNLTKTVAVKNTGGSTGTVDAITLVTGSSAFSVSPPAPFPVAPGTSQVVSVTYTPVDTSAASGTVEIDTDDAHNRLILVSLIATGVVPNCSLQIGPAELDFGAAIVGTNRDLAISITNNSLAACTISSITQTGSADFAIVPAPALPIVLSPGDTTNLVVEFTPSGGWASNTVSIVSGSPDRTNTVKLTGLGAVASSNCAVSVSKSALEFGNVAVGDSVVLKAKVSNTSLSNCSVQSLLLTGDSQFTLIAPPLPIALPGASEVEIGVRYAPSVAGPAAGSLDVVSDDLLQPIFTVSLTGTGVECNVFVIPNALDFGKLPVGQSLTLAVVLTNASAVDCRITSVGISGSSDFALDPIVPTSPFTLESGGTVLVPVTYVPSQQGDDSGTLRIFSNDPNSPLAVSLSGTGLKCNLTVSPLALDFGATVLGHTNTLTVTLGNTGNTNCEVEALTVIGSGRFEVVSPATPVVVPPGGQVEVNVDYLPANIQTIVIQGGDVRTTGNPRTVTP